MKRPREITAPAGPAGVDGHCIYGCGAWVRAFADSAGQVVQLDDHDLPQRMDLSDEDIRHRLFRFYGVTVGWVAAPVTPTTTRSWRPLRVQHDCDRTPWSAKPRRARPVPVRAAPTSNLLHTTTTGRNRN